MEVVLSTPWAVLIVLLPLAGAALSFLFGRRAGRVLAVFVASGVLLTAGGLCCQVWESGPLRYALGGWGAPLGIDWYVDGLTALMLLMTAIVGLGISVYSLGYFARNQADDGNEAGAYFWPLWLFLWAALNALYLSADLFNIYVTLELAGIASVALVALSGGRDALTAGMRYLLVALLGSLAYLMGVAILYGAYSTLDISALGRLVAPGPASWTAIALMTAGLLAKTALFPLHFWLPPAHANAPTPVSAALSGLVVKASFYLVLRLWFQAFGAALTPGAGTLLGILGAAAVLWGSVLALRQVRIKMLIAYSTVAQLGYLFLVFPIVPLHGDAAGGTAAAWSAAALSGSVYHALSHAAAKAAMFMTAGNVIHALGHDRIEDLGGVGRRMPMTAFAFGLAGISLMGLPPSGGFIGKWLLLNGALESGQWWWAIVMISGGLLAAGYVFKVFRHAFEQGREEDTFHPAPLVMELSALVLAIISLALGFIAAYPLALLKNGM